MRPSRRKTRRSQRGQRTMKPRAPLSGDDDRFTVMRERRSFGGVDTSTEARLVGVTFRCDAITDARQEINVSCANARDILAVLGLAPRSGDLWGSVPARELRARTARWLWPERAAQLAILSSRPEVSDHETGRASLVSPARGDTYLADRLTRLHDLADHACRTVGENAQILFD